jgi:hypothetical protein
VYTGCVTHPASYPMDIRGEGLKRQTGHTFPHRTEVKNSYSYTSIAGAGVAQSVQCMTMDWATGRSKFDPRQRQRIFPVTSVSRPALGSTQPPVQWVPGVLSTGLKRGRGVSLTTHPHLVPRSSTSSRHTSSPPLRLHRCAEGLLFYTSISPIHFHGLVAN